MEELKNLLTEITVAEAGHAVVNDDWKSFINFFPYYRIYHIVSGEADVILTNGSMRIKSGNIYFVPAFSIKSAKLITDTLDHEWVHFTVDTRLNHYIETAEKSVSYTADEGTSYMFRRIIEIYESKSENPIAKNAALSGLVSYLLSQFFIGFDASQGSEKERFSPVLKYIESNLSQKITNDDLCRLVYLNKIYFSNLFAKLFGVSPKQYVQQKRMMTAATMLVTTNKPIKEIAEEVGYYDDAYFNRSFTRFTHMTPREYRRMLQK